MERSTNYHQRLGRRKVIAGAVSTVILPSPGLVRAETAHSVTPRLTEGPFYPYGVEGDTDWDLTRFVGASSVAAGQILDLKGKILTADGAPAKNALVEIWQCDNNAVYHHPSVNQIDADAGFQGYGGVRTGLDGQYKFRTIKPVPYPGRAPHIHFKITSENGARLTTQMFIRSEQRRNMRDGLYRSLSSAQQDAVTVALAARTVREENRSILEGQFDIALPS